jgi:uncharacterized membrane protein
MSTRTIARAALVAALYAAITVALGSISYGPIQLRVSEALVVLPLFMPEAVPGLFVGAAIGNMASPAGIVDVVLGSLATLLGAYGTWRLRDRRLIALACPVAANALIVPAYLLPLLGADAFPGWFGPGLGAYVAGVITVGAGEVVAVFVLGGLLLVALERAGLTRQQGPKRRG